MKNNLRMIFIAMIALVGTKQAFAQCVQTAPYSENFDGASWTPGTGFSNTGDAIDPCWTRNPSTGFIWGVGTGTTGSSNTGPDDDVTGGGNYIYTEASNGSTGDLAEIISPEIDLSPLTVPQLRFYYHMLGSSVSSLDVEITDDGGTTWTNISSIVGEQQASETDPFIEQLLTISSYAGQTVQFRFSVSKGGSFCDIAVDEFSVQEAPTCPAPSNISLVSVTSSEVELTWTPGNTETNWNIEFGTAGFTQGTGSFEPVTSTTETVTGLTQNTTYDFYIQADCGGGDESTWVGPFTVTTECGTFTAPWTEDFETAGVIPDCWEQGAANQKDWEFDNTTGSDNIGSDGTINGSTNSNGYFAWLDDSSPHATGTELLSPMIDVSGLTAPMLEFYRLSDNQGDANVDFSVDVWDGAAWNTDVYFSNSNSFDKAWEYISVSLTGLTITGDIQIRFVVDENNGTDLSDDVAIDDVSVIETPSCIQPGMFSASNATATTVDLSWIAGGTETAWNIEYGTEGFIQGTGSFEPVNGTTNFTLTGLNPMTSYDFYLQADCGGGDESAWIGPINASTLIAPVNCAAGINTFLFSAEFETGIPSGWTNTATGDPQWELGSGTTGSSNTGPSGAFSGAEYLFLEASGGSLGDSDTLKASVDLTQGSSEAKMSFYYHMYGADMGELIVETSTDGGATWTNEFTQAGQDQAAETDSWSPVEIDLTPYLGSVVDYRIVGIRGDGFESDMAIDFFNIETCVSCPQPTVLNVANITSSTANVGWTIGNTETEWILEYGAPGFTPGNGTTLVTSNNPETITGLQPDTQYEVNVRAICAPGDTSSYSQPTIFTTECVTYMAPFLETFDSGVQPDCWDNLTSAVGSTDDDAYWDFDGGPGYGATSNGRPDGTFAWSDGSTPTPDSVMLITPNIDLSPLTEPYLEFDWFSNNEDNPGDNVPLIIDVLDNGVWVNIDTLATDSVDWMTVSYDLDTLSGQTVKFRFMTNQSVTTDFAYYNDILLDDVRVDNCNPVPGQDGAYDFCRLDDTLNLNDNIIVKGQNGGRWFFPADPGLLVDDTMLVVTGLPAASYEAYYVVDGICTDDTTVASINVFAASSAGQNGALEVCQNEPVNLYEGLSGTVDLGGDWYDPANNLLPTSQPTASNIPGIYNYDYIASNGLCPADTALVEVEVLSDCDWLSIGEEEMNDISVYPNPATNMINIVNPANTSALKVEIFDVNGRVVVTDEKALENSTEGSIAIDHLETGIYTLRVYGENGQKTFKIVKK